MIKVEKKIQGMEKKVLFNERHTHFPQSTRDLGTDNCFKRPVLMPYF